MATEVSHFQVNVSDSTAQVYVNLFDKNDTQIGRLELDDMERMPLMSFTLDMLRETKRAEWDDRAKALFFDWEEVGGN